MLLFSSILLVVGCRTPPVPESTDDSDAAFLQKPSPQAIRVMNFNVGWDSIFPDDDPQNDRWRTNSKSAEFLRMVKAIHPDVICLQEINSRRDPGQVGAILDAALPLAEGKVWQASSGQDNVIAARFDLGMTMEQRVSAGSITNFGHALALVDLPDAAYEKDLYLICAHFKSQGGQQNIAARQKHADAIVSWLKDIKSPGGLIDLPAGLPIIILGDLNVYNTDPAYHLTTLLTGDIVNEAEYGDDIEPDWDDTPLTDALPRHNGRGEETYTWRDDTQEFNPGVLDHIIYTDSVITAVNAFVLNTTTMSAAALAETGLRAGDVMMDPKTGRYDHLPLVVDIEFLE